jgi:hypothetical protein
VEGQGPPHHAMMQPGLGRAPGGEVAWWVPLRSPRGLSGPFLTEKFKKIFLEFFEKLYFRGFFRN